MFVETGSRISWRLTLHAIWPALAVCLACTSPGDSPKYAAPEREFDAAAAELATSWPDGGPPTLWTRKLGPGYSGIAGDADRIYTLYRAAGQEVVVALDARSGETVWEYRYDAPLHPEHDPDYGDGPNGRPLLDAGRLYSIGVAGLMHCLDAGTGALLWSHALWGELGGNPIVLGYASTPVPYEGTVITLVGGEGHGIVAFDKQDGHVVWQNLDFLATYGSPVIVNVQGKDQLIAPMESEVIGADPRSGELYWRYAIVNEWKQNISAPLLIGDDLLFISTLQEGSRGLRPVEGGVEEVWSSQRMQLFYTDAVLIGDTLYGSSGYSAAPIVTALEATTGELVWRARGFAVAALIGVGDRLIIFDEEGKLALATPGPEGLTVHAEAQVATHPARTPPTLLGTTLYVRDFQEIMALDLGR